MTFLSFVRANVPFLFAGMLLSFMSSFGQTFFIALFAAQIMAEFALSDGQWGLIYTVATTAAAATMVWAGALTDRFRVRHIGAFTLAALAASCIALSVSTGWVALLAVIFALRIFGQGMMSHVAIVATARWFVASRGRALSVVAMGFSLGQAILPVIFVALLLIWDWRLLWVGAAGLIVLTIPLLTRLLRAERTPQSVAADTPVAGMNGVHWSRRRMMRHWLFWGLVPIMLGPSAWGTSLFFHQVHLTAVKGWPLVDYVALMPLLTATIIAATFTSGALIDRFGTSRLMQIYMIPFAAGFAIMAVSETLVGATLALVCIGIGMGGQSTLPAAFWAEYYGTRHLGELKAMTTAIAVLGSAIGPGITGALIDLGMEFPRQMIGMAVYYLATAALTGLMVQRARALLPTAPQINVIRP